MYHSLRACDMKRIVKSEHDGFHMVLGPVIVKALRAL
jgi:hypothetical protein